MNGPSSEPVEFSLHPLSQFLKDPFLYYPPIYYLVFQVAGSRGSSVRIESGYGLDERAIEVRSPAEAKGFFF
jgi:hypothetical protein